MGNVSCEVLVVGAGPVGLFLAYLLRRQGLSPLLVDQRQGAVMESRATDLQPRSLEILDTAGLIDAFLARGRRVSDLHFYSQGSAIFSMGMRELETAYPFILSVPQSETEEILLSAYAAQGGELWRETKLLDAVQEAEGVRCRVVQQGRERTVWAHWLVGCDGARSTVRGLLGLAFEGHSYEESFVIADVSLLPMPDNEALHLYFHEEGFMTLIALPGEGRYRLFFDVGSDVEKAPPLEELEAMLVRRTGQLLRIVGLLWSSVFRIHQRSVSKMQVGRVFLAGDAAHIHSPAGGQGMNTGLQDAWNLSWKLGVVVQGGALASLLDTYHEERHPIAQTILWETEIATWSSMLRNPVMRSLRDLGARVSSWLPPLQHWLSTRCAEIDLGYVGSRLSQEKRGSWWRALFWQDDTPEVGGLRSQGLFSGGPRPGERVPDAMGLMCATNFLEDGLGVEAAPRFALRDLTRHPHHTLLLLEGESASLRSYEDLADIAMQITFLFGEWVRVYVLIIGEDPPPPALEGCAVIMDTQGALHRTLGSQGQSLYLLRPDGHIAYRCQPAQHRPVQAFLETYLLPPSALSAPPSTGW